MYRAVSDAPQYLSNSCEFERAFVQLVTGLDVLAVVHHEVGPPADGVAVQLLAGVVENDNLPGLVGLLDAHRPRELGDLRLPLGLRASNSSTTRGRPWVMSAPATPPVWNVRMVELACPVAHGLRSDVPTASPMATRSLAAKERP